MSYDNIPQEMRAFKNWICFKLEPRGKDGKLSKVPYNPLTGHMAKSNAPNTWVTFNDAINFMDRFDGIGFQFTNSPFVGVDIDHCIENGKMTAQAMEIVKTLNSYTEYSPSGTGLHIICKGNLPEGGNRKGPYEMYSNGRYFTVTGKTLQGYTAINESTGELKQVHSKYIGQAKKPAQNNHNEKKAQLQGNSLTVDMMTQDIIKAINKSKQADKFNQLMQGNISGYPSQSEAEQAFCNILAFFTGKEIAKMDEIFRQSALYRPKWDEVHDGTNTYGTMTMNKAINDCHGVYDPNYHKKQKEKRHSDNRAKDTDIIPNPQWVITEENSNGNIVPIKVAFENTEYLCKELNIDFRYNQLTKKLEVSREDLKDLTFESLVTRLRGICHKNGFKVSKNDLIDNIGLIAERNKYNPVCDYLNECQKNWDGITRIKQLFDMLELDPEVEQDSVFLESLFRKWLLSCVRLAFNKGDYAAQGILVLCGEQGIGKTRFLYTLLPNPSWGIDGMSLDPTVKDDVLAVIPYWIVELGEMGETLKKEKQDKLKAFFTKKKDATRKPYGRATEEIPRTTAFIGTVNGDGFLKDRTGERRYWVIAVSGVKGKDEVDIDINQLWGEVMDLAFNKEERDWLTKEEIDKLNNQNERYKKITSEEQILLDKLDWEAPDMCWKWMTSTEICDCVGVQRTKNGLIGKALGRLSKIKGRLTSKIKRPTNNMSKKYFIPPVKISTNEFLHSPY